MMERTKVYDLPTRLFHWLFAGGFAVAFMIAEFADDDSEIFSYHMLVGLLLVALVGLRLIWGLVGSRYARFSSFRLRPAKLLTYFTDLLKGRSARELGHNPASSWAAVIMLALALGLGLTGYLMTASGGDPERWEDLHELMANAFLFVVIAHVGGVVLHTLRHRDQIGFSMLSGNKRPIAGEEGIPHSHIGAGVIFIALVGALVLQLYAHYDRQTSRLDFFGSTLQLNHPESEDHDD
jgi:cytochrome b